MANDPHRAQLSEFLRSCRARLSPADVGLPQTGRRRTPGLRREDVAVLAGLSVTWYTWLEQGRDVRASERVLENISTTLQLTPEERDYLFALVQSRPAPLAFDGSVEVPPAVTRMIQSLDIPAHVMTMRWDVIAWNSMVTATFRDYAKLPASGRNLVKILLRDDPRYQSDPEEYFAIARRVLSKLRVDYSQAAGDPQFDALIKEMTNTCPMFAQLWGSTEIRNRSEGFHSFNHPIEGLIAFEHTSYTIEGAPTLRVVIFAPQDTESAAKLKRIARGTAEADKEMPSLAEPGERRPKKARLQEMPS